LGEESSYGHISAEEIIEQVINRMYQKNIMVHIKTGIRKTLAELPDRHKQTIRSFFISERSTKKMSEESNKTIRTAQRQTKSAIEKFATIMWRHGITVIQFNSLAQAHKWIQEVYDKTFLEKSMSLNSEI